MSFSAFTMIISMLDSIDDYYKVASWFDGSDGYMGINYVDNLLMSLNIGRDY